MDLKSRTLCNVEGIASRFYSAVGESEIERDGAREIEAVEKR